MVGGPGEEEAESEEHDQHAVMGQEMAQCGTASALPGGLLRRRGRHATGQPPLPGFWATSLVDRAHFSETLRFASPEPFTKREVSCPFSIASFSPYSTVIS